MWRYYSLCGELSLCGDRGYQTSSVWRESDYMNDYSLYGLSYVLADYSCGWNYINDFSPPYGILPVPLDYLNNFPPV